jgi:Zn-dependent peptidase ImmA (M78 family)
MYYSNTNEGRSVLASLRALIPKRSLLFSEALQIAELQANRLLSLTGVTDGALPNEAITELPRIRLAYRDLPTSGLSYWDGQCWVICLNATEPRTRQRFTLLHEYKHIIDHGRTEHLYTGSHGHNADQQAEQAADYFAGCALMPKRLVKRAWGQRVQRPTVLAAVFDVSARAMDVRLAQLGLTEPRSRCSSAQRGEAWPRPSRSTYYRALEAIRGAS